MDRSGVALEEHLGNAGGEPEVSVDLKRWMGEEQIGIKAAAVHRDLHLLDEADRRADELHRAVALAEPCP